MGARFGGCSELESVSLVFLPSQIWPIVLIPSPTGPLSLPGGIRAEASCWVGNKSLLKPQNLHKGLHLLYIHQRKFMG